MSKENEFKVVEDNTTADQKKTEKPNFTAFEDKAKITEAKMQFNETGLKLQKYIAQNPQIPYAKKRLFGEYFNILCSAVDCLTALESVTE